MRATGSDLVRIEAVTISSGNSLSAAIDLNGEQLVGLTVASTWTSANIGFTAAPASTGTYGLVYTSTGLYTRTATATDYIAIPPEVTYGARFIKVASLNSGGSTAAVNQGADRSDIYIHTRRVK